MFLFIGESIGLQELIFIGVIALIVFGPRKLPQMAKTIGKIMADFRRTTNDFKETWQREVDFEEFKEEGNIKNISPTENTIAKNGHTLQNQIVAPEVKEINAADFEQEFKIDNRDEVLFEEKTDNTIKEIEKSKQSWL